MREKSLPPNAPALLGSLRAIGYSFDSALADIVDNSVAAGAREVAIEFRPGANPYVAVIDDGTGMSPAGLEAAMQHGGVGPESLRREDDLGRFGLGLKTASLSQCRRVTVVTLQNSELSGAVWDLDRIEATAGWTLGLLDDDELDATPHVDRIRRSGHGTVVLWEVLDRALAGEVTPDDALGQLMDRASGHLGLVFHRYIRPDAGYQKLLVHINGLEVEAADPFLTSHSTELPTQSLGVDGHKIRFTPFILPHRSRLSRKQLALVDGEDGLRRNQGFYVYRSRRLITSGTWFRLIKQEELTKLARVRVDIPNALDHLWHLDVKKATAVPPHQVRAGLNQVIARIAGSSKRVYTHRGWKDRSHVTRLWDRLETDMGVNYRINREHPAVTSLLAMLQASAARSAERVMQALEMTIPFDAIYADLASEREVVPRVKASEMEDRLRELIEGLVEALRDDPEGMRRALEQLPMMEPFAEHPAATRKVIDEVLRRE